MKKNNTIILFIKRIRVILLCPLLLLVVGSIFCLTRNFTNTDAKILFPARILHSEPPSKKQVEAFLDCCDPANLDSDPKFINPDYCDPTILQVEKATALYMTCTFQSADTKATLVFEEDVTLIWPNFTYETTEVLLAGDGVSGNHPAVANAWKRIHSFVYAYRLNDGTSALIVTFIPPASKYRLIELLE